MLAVALAAAGAALLFFTLLPPPPKPPEKAPPAEKIVAKYERKFTCSVYYTPRESGFKAEGGFDVARESRPGLSDHEYPRDFLRAVEKEGFGRISEPVEGRRYIFYRGGEWGFANEPINQHQRPLVPKKSCAVAARRTVISDGAQISLVSEKLPAEVRERRWVVGDTGSGVDEWQVDLYWGEDDPLGPDEEIRRPKTGDFHAEKVTVLVWE